MLKHAIAVWMVITLMAIYAANATLIARLVMVGPPQTAQPASVPSSSKMVLVIPVLTQIVSLVTLLPFVLCVG